MKSILKSLSLAAGLTAILFSCSPTISDFAFHTNDKSIALRSNRSVTVGRQGKFLPVPNGGKDSANSMARTTVLYSLDRSETTGPAVADFYLTYLPVKGPLTLHLFQQAPDAKKVDSLTATLPTNKAVTAGTEVKFLVPLQPGTRITAFQVTSTSQAADIEIRGVGLTTDLRGIRYEKGLVVIRKGMSIEAAPSVPAAQTRATNRTTLYRFSDLTGTPTGPQSNEQTQVALTYSYAPAGGTDKASTNGSGQSTQASGAIHLAVRNSDGDQRRYLVQPRLGTHQLYLYTASCGFTPDSIAIISNNDGFKVDSLLIHPFPTASVSPTFSGTLDPIPADFGTVLEYSPKWWRRSDYEIFSWSLVPSVIIIEFRSYAIQSRFMKRIAFFVEKQGYAGRLWTNAQLAGLHGWNAHDYRPEDLARFFSAASKEDFALNPEESHLRTILIENGLIEKFGSGYKAGEGAILSFAHVGPEWLRWLLLTHEGYHGIFFTHPDYRKAVFTIWDRAPQAERAVFRDIFLPYFRYNTTDDYLVKNEFQAYLMQQSIDALDGYFKRELAVELRAMKIPASSPLAGYIATHPHIFRKSAEEVQNAVEKAVGAEAGNLIGLQPE